MSAGRSLKDDFFLQGIKFRFSLHNPFSIQFLNHLTLWSEELRGRQSSMVLTKNTSELPAREAVFESRFLPNLNDYCPKNLIPELTCDFIGQFWRRYPRVLKRTQLNEGDNFT
jgi:hypothetical protein